MSQFLSKITMAMTGLLLIKDGRTYTKNGIHMHLGRGGPLRIIEILSPDDEKDSGQPKTTNM